MPSSTSSGISRLHADQRFGVRVRPPLDEEAFAAAGPILYALIGDFPVYDDVLYSIMSEDRPRAVLYEQELAAVARGKVVLDIGTGGHANWAIRAAQAGACRVFAMEYIPSAHESAARSIAASGYGDVITLLHGKSTELSLPERADVCVSDVIGCLAGSEGAREVLSDARARLVQPDGVLILDQATTRVAACRLGDDFRANLALASEDVPYIEQVFRTEGRPFDIRMTVFRFPDAWLRSSAGEMEQLRFNGDLSPAPVHTRLTITSDGPIDGFVAWLHLDAGPNSPDLDTLRTETSWPPTFFPAFYPGLDVRRGDVIELTTLEATQTGKLNPDYLLTGRVLRGDVLLSEFEYRSDHVAGGFRTDAFYRDLFPSVGTPQHGPQASP